MSNPQSLSVVKCARIASSMDAFPTEAPAILAANRLDAETWETALEAHETAMMAELQTGNTELLYQFDHAYVARLEEERGRIDEAQYAQLVVGAERGNLDQVQGSLEIPPEAMPHIERVFLRRYPNPEALRTAIQSARETR